MSPFIVWSIQTLAIAQETEQAPSYEEMSLADLLEVKVTTATRNERSVSDAPATVYLVTDDVIRTRGYTTVIDVLRDLPEVQIGLRTTEETAAWVTMRGISGNDQFLVLRDGVRASAPTGRLDALLQAWSLFDVKRIEVILGPASALYGADAFAGIINIITKDGSDMQGATLTASYGMFNTTHDSVMWGDNFGDVEVALSAQLYHSDDPYFPKYYPEDYTAFEEYRQTGQLEGFGDPIPVENLPWRMPYDAGSVHAKVSIYDLDVGYFINGERFVPGYSSTVSQTMHSDKAQYYLIFRDQLSAHHRYETLGDRPISFDTILARNSIWLDPNSGYANLFTGYERSYKGEFANQTIAQELIAFTLADGWTLSTGLSYDLLSGMPKTADLAAPYDMSKPTGSQTAYYAGTTIPVTFYTIEDRNIGATAQIQARLAPSVEVTLGSRFDNSQRYGATINPRASVVLHPVKSLTTKLLYGEAFLAPTLFAAYQHYGSFNCTATDECDGGFFHIPSPDLKPTKLRTGELLASVTWTKNVVSSFSAFYSQLSNRLDLEGDSVTGPFLGVENVTLQYAVNRGSQQTYGGTIKTEVDIPVDPIDLRVDAAYTYIDGDIDLDDVDKALPNTAPHSVKAGVTFEVQRLSLAPRLIVVSNTLTTQSNVVPAWVLLNLAARYNNLFNSERAPLDLFVTATNLLDQRYYAPPAVDLGGGFTMPMIPQDPLRINGGLSLSF